MSMRRNLIALTFSLAGMAFLFPAIQLLPGLSFVPYLYLLVFLPGAIVGSYEALKKDRFRAQLPLWIILLLMIGGIVWTEFTEIGRALLLTASFGTTIQVSSMLRNREDWFFAARTFVWATLASTGLLLVDWISQPSARFGAMYNHVGTRIMEPNVVATQLGFACLVIIVIVFYRAHNSNPFWVSLELLVLPILLAALLLTGSRGALFSLLVSVLVLVFWIHGRAPGALWLYTCYAVAWSVFLLVAIPNPVRDRLTLANMGSFSGRLPIWSVGLDYFLSDPRAMMIGAGTGGASQAIAAHNPTLYIARISEDGILRANSHSSYVEWLASFGLLGVLVALVAFVPIFVRASIVDRGQPLAFGIGFLAFFLMTSFTLIAFRLEAVSIACGAITLGYIFTHQDERDSPNVRMSRRRRQGLPKALGRVSSVHD